MYNQEFNRNERNKNAYIWILFDNKIDLNIKKVFRNIGKVKKYNNNIGLQGFFSIIFFFRFCRELSKRKETRCLLERYV